MVSTGVWVAVVVVIIICIVPIFWITNKAYSRKWEDDPNNSIDQMLDPELDKQKES